MIHPPDCTCTDTLGCRIRRESSLQLSPGQARTELKGRPRSQNQFNSWERGVAGEQRKGGFMPYLDAKGNVIPIKKGTEKRFEHRETRRRQHERAVSAGHHH